MQLLKRNQKKFYYKNYTNIQTELVDEDGYYSGERGVGYSDLKSAKAYITPEKGNADGEMFGKELDYDRVMYLPLLSDIDEYTILWVDASITKENDYVVKRVATGLNHKVVAIKKVR